MYRLGKCLFNLIEIYVVYTLFYIFLLYIHLYYIEKKKNYHKNCFL